MRQSGITSRQLKNLPPGSLFVVQDDAMKRYAENLAKHLQREGIRIVTPIQLRKCRGERFPAIEVDHAAQLSLDEWLELDCVRLEVRTSDSGADSIESDVIIKHPNARIQISALDAAKIEEK